MIKLSSYIIEKLKLNKDIHINNVMSKDEVLDLICMYLNIPKHKALIDTIADWIELHNVEAFIISCDEETFNEFPWSNKLTKEMLNTIITDPYKNEEMQGELSKTSMVFSGLGKEIDTNDILLAYITEYGTVYIEKDTTV